MRNAGPAHHTDMAGLLDAPDFIRLWAVGGLANALRWLEALAVALFTLEATGSGLMVAVVSASRSLPLIAMGAFAGVLSDAMDRKRILVGGMLLSAAASAAVCALAWAGVLAPWHLILAGLASGLVYGTELPARRRMLGESVSAALLPRAVALDSLTGSLSRVAGPLIGGAAYQWIGVSASFACTAALSLLAAAVALGVRWRQETRPLRLASMMTELAEGAMLVRRTPALLALLGATVAMNLCGYAYSSLVAPLGETVFHASPELVGVLAAAEPAGGSLGGLLLTLGGTPRIDPVWLLLGGAAGLMAILVLMPWVPGFWLACVLLGIGGLGVALYANVQTTIALTETPFALRSRVMGLVTTAIGMWPVGMLIAGGLGDAIGPLRAMLALGTGGLLLLSPVGLLYALRPRPLQQSG
jgi:predicted MFS family arabinose efflux permease